MITEIILMIIFLIGFVFLIYSSILLIRRKEYENKRILKGYNVLILSVFILALAWLVKTLRFVYAGFEADWGLSLVHFDIISNLVLIPLFAIALIAGMIIFREV